MSEIQFILEEQEAYIDWANARIATLEAEKASRESAIKDKDAVIAALTTRLQEAEANEKVATDFHTEIMVMFAVKNPDPDFTEANKIWQKFKRR